MATEEEIKALAWAIEMIRPKIDKGGIMNVMADTLDGLLKKLKSE
jgi:hypothetical protein